MKPNTELPEALRVVDASANRCREGLRVIEDFLRFVRDDAFLTGIAKQLRHDLTGLLAHLPQRDLHAARSTLTDVGTQSSTEAEGARTGTMEVAQAAFGRVGESLRSLEEFSKLVDRDLAARFEQLRYRSYTLQKAVTASADAQARLASCRLCLLIGGHPPDKLIDGIPELLDAGVDMIQLREKSADDRSLLETAKILRRVTAVRERLFIVNDRPEIAALVDADGVHLGQDDLPIELARRIVGTERLIGVSTHSIQQARQAVLAGASYLGVGPTFPSATKQFEHLAGLEFVQQAAEELSLPWFAIGGITAENLGTVIGHGGSRIAVSSGILAAPDPVSATRELSHAFVKIAEDRS